MSASSTSGLAVELLLRVTDVKYGYFTLIHINLLQFPHPPLFEFAVLFKLSFLVLNSYSFYVSLDLLASTQSLNLVHFLDTFSLTLAKIITPSKKKKAKIIISLTIGFL